MARGYETIWQDGSDILTDIGFDSYQCRMPGLLIPTYDAFGNQGWQYRPDNPRTDQTGKPIKYEQRAGDANRLGIHPLTRACVADPSWPIWVTEGTKKGDALVSHGQFAVIVNGVWGWRGTNEHGGKTALSDWHEIALNDRLVYVVFDSDAATNENVRKAETALSGYLKVRGAEPYIVRLPAAATGKTGVDDYLAAGGTIKELLRLASVGPSPRIEIVNAPEKRDPITFPIDSLPPSVAEYVSALTDGGLSLDYCGTTALPLLGGAIGGNMVLEIGAEWEERAILWAVLVGEPGQGKSAPVERLGIPLRDVQERHLATYETARAEYEAMTAAQRRGERRPVARRLWVDDATLESLALLLRDNAAGVVQATDELRAVIQGLGQYKARAGADRAKFLALWTGNPLVVDRVKDGGVISVPHPFVPLVGTLQPANLSVLDSDDGLRDRFLLTWPREAMSSDYRGFEVESRAARENWHELIWRLCELRDKSQRRIFGREDRALFESEYARLRRISGDQDEADHVRSWAAKAPKHLARLALVLGAAWFEDERMRRGEATASMSTMELPQGALQQAVLLVDYFMEQHRRLYIPKVNLMAPAYQRGRDQAVDKLVVWLEGRPNRMAARGEIARAKVGGARTKEEIDALLERYAATFPGRVVRSKGDRGPIGEYVYAPDRKAEMG